MSVYLIGPATSLSPADVEALWVNNGGDPSKASIAVAIVFSSENPAGNAGLVNDTPSTGDYSIGLWQINYAGSLLASRSAQFGSPEEFAADPNLQARAAIAMSSNGQNWQAWGPDLGYSGYGQQVTDPLPGSRVGNWLGVNAASVIPTFPAFKPLLIAGSLFVLASLAAEAISPGSSPLSPKNLRALRG